MDISLLKRLTMAPGIPGGEGVVRDIVEEILRGLTAEIITDAMGSLVARVPGEGPKLLIDAHMDEVGLMVQHIDELGFIKVITVGGIDPRVLYGQSVIVWGTRPLQGIIGSVAPHLLSEKDGQKERIIPVDELFIDLGLHPKDVGSYVRVGDPVTFPGAWSENEDFLQAKAFDDRAGLFVMLEALKRVPKPGCELYLVASAQEEMGLKGAGPVARSIDPDLVLALEGTMANDLPGVPSHRVFARLGKGPEIRLSDGRFLADRAWSNFLIHLAEEAGIPYQVVVKKVGGTNAAALQVEGTGARAAALSVPVRYIHAPVSLLNRSDLKAAIALVARVIKEIKNFEPDLFL
nr:M42 family peptidase [Deltaproteobacteria bacterium]